MSAKIYIANGTPQNHQFHYRVPERQNPRIVDIPAGRQVSIDGDNEETTAMIIEQLERYGAVPKSSIRLIRSPRTLIYSIDRKAIDSNKIDEARERDEVARQEVAAQKTQDAGLSLLPIASNKGGNPDAIKATSLEVTQVSDMGETKNGVNVEINVRKDAPGKMQTGKRA